VTDPLALLMAHTVRVGEELLRGSTAPAREGATPEREADGDDTAPRCPDCGGNWWTCKHVPIR